MRLVDVVLGAERALVEDTFGALIDDSPLVPRERQAVLVVLEKILAHLRPDLFEEKTQMGCDRVVAQDRMPWLEEIAQPED